MKNILFKLRTLSVLSLLSFGIYSCTKDVQQQQIAQPLQSTVSDVTTVYLPGRTLAANCFQCHGTNGHAQGEMSLAGMSASEIIDEINEMKTKNPGANIMNVHAQAYTDAEVILIADFFSKQ